jgi:hypothetical protein
LPVCARHSGLAEVAGALADALPPDLAELTSFELGSGAVPGLADRLGRWLAVPTEEREPAGAALVEAVRARWSWEGVAESVLAASAGRLEALDRVPSD